MSGNKVGSLGLCHVLCLKLGDLSFHSTTLRVTKLWWWIYHVVVMFLCHGDGLVSRSSSPLMGLTNQTYLDDLIQTDKATLTDGSTWSLRRSGHITDEDKEAIQCSQINALDDYRDNCTDRWEPSKLTWLTMRRYQKRH